MYTSEERADLLNKLILFFQQQPLFEGLLQIGSGVSGFSDRFSDVDLMACTIDEPSVLAADQLLTQFFHDQHAVYLEKRVWTDTVLGISAYFQNGLSVDLSFMATEALPIRSSEFRISL